jgi:transmembrane sensor
MKRSKPRYDVGIAQEAADWVARLKERPSRRTVAAVRQWTNMSPEHCREFLVAAGIYKVLQGLGAIRSVDVEALIAQASTVVSLSGRPELPAVDSVRNRQGAAREASGRSRDLACVKLRFAGRPFLRVAAVLPLFALTLFGDGLRTSAARQEYSTVQGQSRTISLGNGTVIYLNADSALTVTHTPHAFTAVLYEGEALFDVHHVRQSSDQLWVLVDGVRLQDIGTRFDVQRQPAKIVVSVVQGRVRIDGASRVGLTQRTARSDGEFPSVLAGAGQEVEIERSGALPEMHIRAQPRPELERRMAWAYGWLDFQGETLSQAAYEFSQHNDQEVLVTDPSIAQLRVGGHFRADDLDGWLNTLPYLGVCVERKSDPNERNTVRLSKAKTEFDPDARREGATTTSCD